MVQNERQQLQTEIRSIPSLNTKTMTSYSLDELRVSRTPEAERLKIQAALKRKDELIKALLVLFKLQPTTSSYLAKTMTQTYHHFYDKSNLYYTLNNLNNLGLVEYIRVQDAHTQQQPIAGKIAERQRVFLSKIPTQFRRNFIYACQMKYYWVSSFGESFIPFALSKMKGE